MLKKLNNLAPVVLGLLGAILALLVAVLIVGIVLLRRSPTKGYTEILPTRNVSPSYSQVPVTMPSSKMRSDGTHDYNEPFIAPPATTSDDDPCRNLEFADVFLKLTFVLTLP